MGWRSLEHCRHWDLEVRSPLVADSHSRDEFEWLGPLEVVRNARPPRRSPVLQRVEDSTPLEEDSRRQGEASRAAHTLGDVDRKRLLLLRVYL